MHIMDDDATCTDLHVHAHSVQHTEYGWHLKWVHCTKIAIPLAPGIAVQHAQFAPAPVYAHVANMKHSAATGRHWGHFPSTSCATLYRKVQPCAPLRIAQLQLVCMHLAFDQLLAASCSTSGCSYESQWVVYSGLFALAASCVCTAG